MSLLRTLTHSANRRNAMSLMDHVEDLRWHLIRSLIAVLACSGFAFFHIEWLFDRILLAPARQDFVAYRIFCALGTLLHTRALCFDSFQLEFQNTELSGQFMMSFSVSVIAGLVLAFPYIAWELWRFIMPALHSREIRKARGIVFWMSLLFFSGVLFAYFVIVPFTVTFFAGYQLSPSFRNIITISSYYETLTDLVLGMGVVFQLPVLVYFLSRTGLLTPQLMKQYHRFAILAIVLIAAVITPPDWLSIWLVAIPLTLLYWLSMFISGTVQRHKQQSEKR